MVAMISEISVSRPGNDGTGRGLCGYLREAGRPERCHGLAQRNGANRADLGHT
jgi:hypothetical protein